MLLYYFHFGQDEKLFVTFVSLNDFFIADMLEMDRRLFINLITDNILYVQATHDKNGKRTAVLIYKTIKIDILPPRANIQIADR